MVNILIGYRRTYIAPACSIEGGDSFDVPFGYEDMEVQVHIAKEPRFPMIKAEVPHIVLNGGEMPVTSTLEVYAYPHIPNSLITELICIKQIAITSEVHRAFVGGDKVAEEHLMQLADSHLTRLKTATDFVAGAIALSFDRQFVTEIVNETMFVQPDGNYGVSSSHISSIRVIGPVQINNTSIDRFNTLLGFRRADKSVVKRVSRAVGWLLRAWAEQEEVSKFVSLFIPIEIITAPYIPDSDAETTRAANQIRQLITTYAGEDTKVLLERFEKMIKSPPLTAKFQVLSKQVNPGAWEVDVAAFNRFNRLRNTLMHSGEQQLKQQVTISTEVEQLSNLTERYVRWAFENINGS